MNKLKKEEISVFTYVLLSLLFFICVPGSIIIALYYFLWLLFKDQADEIQK